MSSVPMTSAVRRQPIARKKAALGRRHLRQAMSLLAIGLLVALFLVWARIQVIQLGYEVSRLRKDVRELAQQRDLLEADVASLKSPKRLEGIATERFGMRLPMGDEVIILRRGKRDADSVARVQTAEDLK